MTACKSHQHNKTELREKLRDKREEWIREGEKRGERGIKVRDKERKKKREGWPVAVCNMLDICCLKQCRSSKSCWTGSKIHFAFFSLNRLNQCCEQKPAASAGQHWATTHKLIQLNTKQQKTQEKFKTLRLSSAIIEIRPSDNLKHSKNSTSDSVTKLQNPKHIFHMSKQCDLTLTVLSSPLTTAWLTTTLSTSFTNTLTSESRGRVSKHAEQQRERRVAVCSEKVVEQRER